jgi:ATP-dependent DNA ligase
MPQSKLPAFVEPCLATLVERVPGGDRWLHEIKWDGYRLMARVENCRATMLTRRGHDLTFPFDRQSRRRASRQIDDARRRGDCRGRVRNPCAMGLEGIISKRRDCPYRSGRRKDWLKIKCTKRQEFVVAGYLTSTVSSRAIGALVLGYYDGDRLI